MSAPGIPGLVVIEDWVTADEHDRLVAAIDRHPWDTQLRRRTQHYGHRYDYRTRTAATADAPPLPDWAVALAARLAEEGHLDRPADQVLVNEYLPGQGIAPHVDRDIFGPVVATLSLGDTWPMRFEHPNATRVEVPLPVRSLALLAGPARREWRHGIAPRKTDPTPTGRRRRTRRLSVTFRTR